MGHSKPQFSISIKDISLLNFKDISFVKTIRSIILFDRRNKILFRCSHLLSKKLEQILKQSPSYTKDSKNAGKITIILNIHCILSQRFNWQLKTYIRTEIKYWNPLIVLKLSEEKTTEVRCCTNSLVDKKSQAVLGMLPKQRYINSIV